MAVHRNAVVGAPVCHYAVNVFKRDLARQLRHKPSGGPSAVGAVVQHSMFCFRQGCRVAFCNLQHGANAFGNAHAQQRDGHFRLCFKVAGESAAAEIFVVGTAPVGGLQACVHILLGHLPERLHAAFAVFIFRCTGAVKCGCTGVNQVNKAVCRFALRLFARYTFVSFGAPISTHVMEARRGIRHQGAQHHGNAVERIILCCKRRGGFGAVPVEGRSQNCLGEVAVRQPVRPVALALETACNGVFAKRFLVPAQLGQLRVAIEDIAHDDAHFCNELPILISGNHFGFCDNLGQVLAFVAVKALFAVGANPAERLFVFLGVVDAQRHAAQNFSQVAPLGADAEIFLEHFRVTIAAHDAHGHSAHIDIGFVLHPAHSNSTACIAQNFFLHISGNGFIGCILHVMAVDGKSGQSLLGVCRQHSCEINCARALGAVKAPNRLDGFRVHIKCFTAVAPARGDSQCCHNVFAAEFILASRRLCAAADGAVRNHALHGRAVGIAQIFAD